MSDIEEDSNSPRVVRPQTIAALIVIFVVDALVSFVAAVFTVNELAMLIFLIANIGCVTMSFMFAAKGNAELAIAFSIAPVPISVATIVGISFVREAIQSAF